MGGRMLEEQMEKECEVACTHEQLLQLWESFRSCNENPPCVGKGLRRGGILQVQTHRSNKPTQLPQWK